MQQNVYLQLKNTLYAAVFADAAWYAVSEYQAAVGSFDRRCLATATVRSTVGLIHLWPWHLTLDARIQELGYHHNNSWFRFASGGLVCVCVCARVNGCCEYNALSCYRIHSFLDKFIEQAAKF